MRHVLLLLVSIVALSTPAFALTVDPDTITYTQDSGYKIQIFNVTNPTNHTVSVNITMLNLTGKVFIPSTFFTISNHSTSQFTAVFSLNSTYTGKIKLNSLSGNATINVTVKPSHIQTNFTLIPKMPKAGKNLLIKLNENKDVRGYMLTQSGNVYLIDVKDGIGFLTLNPDDYGDATIYLDNKTTSIRVLSSYNHLYIDTTDSITIGDKLKLTVYADTTPVLCPIILIAPDGTKTNRIVNKTSEIMLNKTGEWNLTASFQGLHAYMNIVVKPKPLSLSLPDVKVNEPVTIDVGKPATIKIVKNEVTWTYTTPSSLSFIPPWEGRYDVTVTTEDGEEGTTSFMATNTASALIIKDENNLPISYAKSGQTVVLEAVDDDGNLLHSTFDVDVWGDTYCETIKLHDGKAKYVLGDAHSYSFTISNTDVGAQVYVKQTSSSNPVWGIVIAVAVGLGISLYVAYTKQWIDFSKLLHRDKYDDLF